MNEIGIKQVAERIHGRLQRYLEAQYHIRDSAFIEERRMLLFEPGSISQRPFVEVTPSYAVCDGFTGLKIPDPVRSLLAELAGFRREELLSRLLAADPTGRVTGLRLRLGAF